MFDAIWFGMKALPKILLALTGVAALSLAHPASVQAGVTYQYTGNTFTQVSGPYTTSDFVTAMVTLAAPLGPNHNLDDPVTPVAFTLSDGVQTITNFTSSLAQFLFSTDATGVITGWRIGVSGFGGPANEIFTQNDARFGVVADGGFLFSIPAPPVSRAGLTQAPQATGA